MPNRLLLSVLVLIYLYFSTLVAAYNISRLLTYSVAQHPDDAHTSPFLNEVLKAIAEKKNWDLRTIRVSKLEKVRFGYSKSHTFPITVGNKRDLVVRYWDQVGSWRNFDDESGSFEQLVNEVKSEAVLRTFLVDGSIQLLVHGGDDQLSLQLPMNDSFSGLKQIIVGEGITLEIGAKEVSFSLSSCNDIPSSGSHINKRSHDYWLLLQSFCLPLSTMRFAGAVYVIAFRRNLSNSTIDKNLLAIGIVELKLKKCYERNMYRETACLVDLSSRIDAAQHLFRTLLGQKINELNHSPSFRKANMKASTFIRFQLELDREVSANDSLQGKFPKWRTKPAVERVWFDIVARVDDGKLKPLTVKQVKPFVGVDSTSWSYFFSNISPSEFSSLLVPPHPLTLDVKW